VYDGPAVLVPIHGDVLSIWQGARGESLAICCPLPAEDIARVLFTCPHLHPFQYGSDVDLNDFNVGQGELGACFQGAGSDDYGGLLLRGGEDAGHQSKGDQGQGADDDER
jgi:hypothetical protein